MKVVKELGIMSKSPHTVIPGIKALLFVQFSEY
jgi:hypothetical protein